GELPRRGLPQYRTVCLATEHDRVLTVEGVRVGVVGRDGRLLERVEVVAEHPRRMERRNARGDARAELARCLARERQPENLRGLDESVGEEPQHTEGHRVRLARARS